MPADPLPHDAAADPLPTKAQQISAVKAKPPADAARALLVEWLDLDFFGQQTKDFRQRVKAFIDAGESR